jgi:hypothetical protein
MKKVLLYGHSPVTTRSLPLFLLLLFQRVLGLGGVVCGEKAEILLTADCA